MLPLDSVEGQTSMATKLPVLLGYVVLSLERLSLADITHEPWIVLWLSSKEFQIPVTLILAWWATNLSGLSSSAGIVKDSIEITSQNPVSHTLGHPHTGVCSLGYAGKQMKPVGNIYWMLTNAISTSKKIQLRNSYETCIFIFPFASLIGKCWHYT